MNIITPISHLCEEKAFFEVVLKYGELEVRDSSEFKGYERFVSMYHSELELTQKWSLEEKRKIIYFIQKFPNLKGLSFHVVTRYPSYQIIQGVAHGQDIPMQEETLLQNAEINVNWLKEKLPRLILMIENNNDLGSDAYKIVTDANFLNKLVSSNNINFLYDHAHAMISAYNQKINFRKYFSELPISRVRQVHLSEPSFENGIAIDSHLAPSTSQIKFCVNNFKINTISFTIEFYKSINELEKSLKILKDSILI